MNIIALVGPSSCGKTTILNIVYQLLLEQQPNSTNRQQEGGNPKDFSDLVEWQ
jgi:ABC-type nitrate/sulfonate/bicarbonate transport system ATPase subunit